jgi:anti-sigma factor RsiW
MSGKFKPPSEELLHAYVDGVLPEAHRDEVTAYLAENPAEVSRMEAYLQQNAALRALGEALDAQPAPVLLPQRRRAIWARPALRAAAAVVLLALGGLGGWWLHGLKEREAYIGAGFVQQAAMAYRTYAPEVLHPVEVPAAQEKHLVAWLSKRLGKPLRAPHLSELGFELVGGRLLPGSTGPAAQLMYQDAQMNRLTLYVLTAGKGSGAR